MQNKIFTITLVLIALISLTACKTGGPDSIAQDRAKVESELGSEIYLKEDRSKFAELRKEIPAETQKNNDELALFLNLMKQGRENPQDIRVKFQALVQTRRTSFRDKFQKLRNDFRNDEVKRREKFLADQKSKRDSYLKRKHDPKASREFFQEQEKERAGFFADERARRLAFEAELSTQSKDFDSFMRERQKDFDEQYRIYSKEFSQRPKDKNAVTGDEFKRLEETKGSPLGTEE